MTLQAVRDSSAPPTSPSWRWPDHHTLGGRALRARLGGRPPRVHGPDRRVGVDRRLGRDLRLDPGAGHRRGRVARLGRAPSQLGWAPRVAVARPGSAPVLGHPVQPTGRHVVDLPGRMGGGAIGVPIYGMLGGYALSGRGPRCPGCSRPPSGAPPSAARRRRPPARSGVAGRGRS
jgi:hypothetical protein